MTVKKNQFLGRREEKKHVAAAMKQKNTRLLD